MILHAEGSISPMAGPFLAGLALQAPMEHALEMRQFSLWPSLGKHQNVSSPEAQNCSMESSSWLLSRSSL